MQQALTLAARGKLSVSPNPMVGCIIVKDGAIIAEGWHSRAGNAHAEVYALQQAGDKAKNSTVYVTLEPCCMCAGAINKARLRNIFFGAYNQLEGCVSSKYNLCNDPTFNHQSGVKGGILQDECSFLLHSFFKDNSSNLVI